MDEKIEALEVQLKALKEDIEQLRLTLSTLSDILKLKEEMINIQRDVKESVNFNNLQVEEAKKSIEDNSRKLETDMKVEMQKIKEEIEDLKAYQRQNNLQIFGIPENKEEDLYKIMVDIGALLNISLKYRDIDVIHRLPASKAGDPKPILVRFVNRWMKEKILIEKRKAKNLFLKNLDFDDQNNGAIYINEHLTLSNQAIFKRARHLKAKGHYKFVWTREGKVLLRKTETSKVIHVSNEALMSKLERQSDNQ